MNLLKNWVADSESRKHLIRYVGIYIGLSLFEILIGIPNILGGIIALFFFIYFGKEVYKNKEKLGSSAITVFWSFAAIYFVFLIFGRSLLGYISPQTSFWGVILFVFIFWFSFVLFWKKESALSLKSMSYAVATGLYFIARTAIALYYYFSFS